MQIGNLAATLLIEPGCTPDRLHQLSFLTGVAVHEAVQAVLGEAAERSAGTLRLKWPNDLLLGRAKLGGILIESTVVGQEAVVAIGIGVNITSAPPVDGRETIALAGAGVSSTARALLTGIDAAMRRWLDLWQSGARFDRVRQAWLERAHQPGEPIIVHSGHEVLAGAFAGIDETGALLIDTVSGNENALRRLTFGDVSLPPR